MHIFTNKHKRKIFEKAVIKQLLFIFTHRIKQYLHKANNFFDKNKSLPAYDEQELVKLKHTSYKKIMNNVGILGIQTQFRKSKSNSFAQFCADAVIDYVNKCNKSADDNFKRGLEDDEYIAVKNTDSTIVSEPGAENLEVNDLKVDCAIKSNIETRIPLMYDMLEKSYNSRSKTERFFSYFPFINPTANCSFINLNLRINFWFCNVNIRRNTRRTWCTYGRLFNVMFIVLSYMYRCCSFLDLSSTRYNSS